MASTVPRQPVAPGALKGVLDDHARWLASGGLVWHRDPPAPQGVRAQFENADLSRTDLNAADLRGAKIGHSDFTDANLRKVNFAQAYVLGANFSTATLEQASFLNAHLEEATFDGARLWQADLRGAVLRNADLSKAQGLESRQLGGADLTLAKLPEEINKFAGLKVVEDASKSAQTIFLAVLGACVYVWLTIASTQDPALLLNSATSELPIVGTAVPIVGFYLIAPLVLLSVYLYLHVNLQRLWEALASLPAKFPDGQPIDQRAYPWMAMGLVRCYFPFLRDDLPRFARLQQVLAVLLLWAVVPITQAGLWARFLPRHDWLGTSVTLTALVFTAVFGLASLLSAIGTLQGMRFGPMRWRTVLGELKSVKGATVGVPLVGVIAFSVLAMIGPRMSVIGRWPYPNLSGATLSAKLDGWSRVNNDRVLGARLAGRNLRYADLSGAFLAKAELTGADLTGARLESADLDEADLTGATLVRADLTRASVRAARFSFANLRESTFSNLVAEQAQRPGPRRRDGFSGGSRFGGLTDVSAVTFTSADLSFANLDEWYLSDREDVRMLGTNLYGVLIPRYVLEAALNNGAVCMADTRAWAAVANGAVEVPEVPPLTSAEAHCHVAKREPLPAPSPNANEPAR